MYFDIWRIGLGKDREHKICTTGLAPGELACYGRIDNIFFIFKVLTASGENRTGASASIEQQVMLTNPGFLF